EGFLSSCGNCAMSCPGTLLVAELDTCDRPGRTCEQVEPAAAGGLAVNLTGPPLPSDTGIYFYTSKRVIRHFDTATRKTAEDYTLPQEDPWFYAPCPDGSLWFNADEKYELIHVGSDGKPLCTFPNPTDRGIVSMAVDETGAAWALYISG